MWIIKHNMINEIHNSTPTPITKGGRYQNGDNIIEINCHHYGIKILYVWRAMKFKIETNFIWLEVILLD